MWLPKPAAEQTIVGHPVIAIHPDALMHAVDQLVAVGPTVKHLKVRAGEHLAALLLTSVCGSPIEIDTAGEVDLIFEREAERDWCFGDQQRAAVEVKSYAGDFREAESRMQIGDSHTVVAQTVLDVLIDATPQVERAIAALARKTEAHTSKHVFLIFHPFDAVPVEVYEEFAIIGHRLPDVAASVELDTLWVLWHPGMLAMWSQVDRRWTDILFDGHDPSQQARASDLDALQEAEEAFLIAIDHPGDSPWRFGLSSG